MAFVQVLGFKTKSDPLAYGLKMTIQSAGLLEEYLKKTGKTREEAEHLILEKTQKFAGLLTDEAALFLLAKEAGIDPDQTPKQIQPVLIKDLEAGQTNIDVVAVAKRVYPIKEFPNKNKPGTGKRCSILLCDATGEIFITLWHQQTDLAKNVTTGTPLLLSNVSVTEYNGQKQLNFGYKSHLEPNPTQIATSELPSFKVAVQTLQQIEGGQNNLCISAIVSKIYPVKTFENDRGTGEYRAFEVKDDSMILRCVAWNESVKQTESLSEGTKVTIENAYSKTNRNGETELHIGDTGRIIPIIESIPQER